MLRIVGRRLVLTVPTLLGVILVAFLLIELMPGDPARILAGEEATPEAVEVIRQDLGLDQPFHERFVNYVADVARGDLGTSVGSTIPIWDRIKTALPITLSLGVVSMAFALVFGVLGGTWAGLRRDRWIDHLVTATSSVALAVPSFVFGLALVVFFAVDRSWFPSGGYTPIGDGLWDWFHHLVLPGIALAIPSMAELARQTRGAIVDTMEEDYIRAVRAKGMSQWMVVAKHAAKNAATPVSTVAGLQVVRILGGAIVIERIFAMNGFGSLAVSAVFSRDLVMIQGVVVVSALFVLATNLLVDLSYLFLNPKARA